MKQYIAYCIFLFVFFLRVKCSSIPSKKDVATSGPFRSILIRTAKCEKTTYSIDKDLPFSLVLEVHNTSTKYFLLAGNFTVNRENKQITTKVKSYVQRNGKWKMTYVMNNVRCNGVLFQLFVSAVGLKYNRETCGFYKGSYTFSGIDINPIQHFWTSKMEYGRVLWTTEAIASSKTYFCWELETLVEPAEK